jgi:hypothetical protein
MVRVLVPYAFAVAAGAVVILRRLLADGVDG